MIITDITQQKNKGRYNLFVDDAFYSGIDDEVIVLYGLKVGQDIDKDRLEEIVISSEKRRAFTKLIDLISRKEYSEREICDKLQSKGYNPQGIKLAVEMAKEYGYINDVEYAKHLTETSGLKSIKEIKNKLYLKGINKKVIDECLSCVSSDQEFENALTLADKYVRNKDKDAKTFSSLYGYLLRKGFSGEICAKVLRQYKYDIEE